MANLDLQASSRYQNYKDSNQNYMNYVYNIPSSVIRTDDDTEYVVIEGDRLFGIANKLFGDPRYWWVILIANDKKSGADIETGDTIYIPKDINLAIQKIQSFIQQRV